MPRDDAHLLDILKAARLAIEFKGPAEKAEFLEDAKTQSAVLHQLLIIGEAVKRISPESRAAHPEVPWKLIAVKLGSCLDYFPDSPGHCRTEF